MPNESKAPNALLWVILLAVLVEPLALALILDREPSAAPAPQSDGALAEAVAALTRQLERAEKSPPPFAPDAPRSPEAEPATVRPPAPSIARPIPKPKPGVPVVPDAVRRYPRKQANVDAWAMYERERLARGENAVSTLFFDRTTAEILAEFGIPDEAYEQANGVRWLFKGSDGGGDLMLDFHAGRVYRFWFQP